MGTKGARADQKILLEVRKWRFFEAGVANPCQLLEPACNFAIMFWCIENIYPYLRNNYT
ncbi:MAG: hypothetical protein ACFFG0_05165 [Candidatus Thorarchaeota archaeon]